MWLQWKKTTLNWAVICAFNTVVPVIILIKYVWKPFLYKPVFQVYATLLLNQMRAHNRFNTFPFGKNTFSEFFFILSQGLCLQPQRSGLWDAAKPSVLPQQAVFTSRVWPVVRSLSEDAVSWKLQVQVLATTLTICVSFWGKQSLKCRSGSILKARAI